MPVLNLSDSQTLALGSSAVKAAYLGSELKHFNPKAISGLEGWWDASDTSSVTLDAGRVAALADKSGNSRHATNGTSGSTQPEYVSEAVNGRNATGFSAASNQLLLFDGIAIPASHTVFMVFTRTENGVNSIPIGSTGGLYPFWWFTNNTSVYQRSNGYTGGFTTTTATGVFVGSVRRTATTKIDARINGDSIGAIEAGDPVANPASGTWNAIGYKATTYHQGDIGEVIVYSESLTDALVQNVESYLSTKWGVTLA